jgi:predicted flap endonuclease-1-like 5' DNA nuclease
MGPNASFGRKKMPSQRSERALEEPPAAEIREHPALARRAANRHGAAGRGSQSDGADAMSLHVSKLRGISLDVRLKLKRQGVSYTHQLLREAGSAEHCRRLAARSGIDEATLTRLVRRADLARIKGIGAIFADMLEMIGVDQVAVLAGQESGDLHSRLHELNTAERLARRSPTPDEVQQWIAQARALPRLAGSG